MTTEPLGLGAIGAYVLARGIITDNEFAIADSWEEIEAFQPDIIGISAVTQTIYDAVNVARQCKERFGSLTILGGYGITCAPHKLSDVFDVGVIGEGELTFAALVQLYQNKKFSVQALSETEGICYHHKGTVITAEPRAFVQDIDAFPFPYRHKIIKDKAPIFTSRGCAYRCSFCDAHIFWKNTYRLRSAESVITEIQMLVEEYQVRGIYITDDLWIADKKRFKKIVDELVRLGLPQKATFHGFVRSNLLFEEEIQLLKKINYRVIRFGAESASDRILQFLKGKNISVADHQRVIDLCAKYDIACTGSFMFGVPGERKEDIGATVNFLRKNKGRFALGGAYPFTPIPGTMLWNDLLRQRKICDEHSPECYPRDFLRDNFSWDNFLYLNEENIPFVEFKEIMDEFLAEFRVRTVKKKHPLYAQYEKASSLERTGQSLQSMKKFQYIIEHIDDVPLESLEQKNELLGGAWYHQGSMSFAAGDCAGAVECFKMCLTYMPGHQGARERYALCCHEKTVWK